MAMNWPPGAAGSEESLNCSIFEQRYGSSRGHSKIGKNCLVRPRRVSPACGKLASGCDSLARRAAQYPTVRDGGFE